MKIQRAFALLTVSEFVTGSSGSFLFQLERSVWMHHGCSSHLFHSSSPQQWQGNSLTMGWCFCIFSIFCIFCLETPSPCWAGNFLLLHICKIPTEELLVWTDEGVEGAEGAKGMQQSKDKCGAAENLLSLCHQGGCTALSASFHPPTPSWTPVPTQNSSLLWTLSLCLGCLVPAQEKWGKMHCSIKEILGGKAPCWLLCLISSIH